MPLSGMGVRRGAWSGVGPTVSARLDGRINSEQEPATVYCGARVDSAGDEWEFDEFANAINQTIWLDTGSSSDVWIERTISSGSWNSQDPGAGRHNLGTTRNFRVVRSTVGSQSCTCTFDFWDAASGGNNLQSTSSSTWTATVIFNPCPTCCFTADTMITMADGTLRRIADVREGDKVLTPTEDGLDVTEMEITEVIVRVDRPMKRIYFSDGQILEASEDHPMYIKGKGWASINPDPRTDYKDIGVPKNAEVGDTVFTEYGNPVKIVKIEEMEHPDAVFTFKESKFFANGILVY